MENMSVNPGKCEVSVSEEACVTSLLWKKACQGVTTALDCIYPLTQDLHLGMDLTQIIKMSAQLTLDVHKSKVYNSELERS